MKNVGHIIHGIIFFCLLISHVSKLQANEYSIHKQYSISEFRLSLNKTGEYNITHVTTPTYTGEVGAPALPAFEINYAIPYNEELDTITYYSSKSEVKSNVKITLNTPIVKYDLKEINHPINHSNYTSANYHNQLISNIFVQHWDGIKVVKFFLSPFEYDPINQTLSLNQNIYISIKTKSVSSEQKKFRIGSTNTVASIVKSFVINDVDVEKYIADASPILSSKPSVIQNQNPIEYLIITNSYLANSFERLCKWRQKLGLFSHIATTEEIYSLYSDATPQLKIKHFIKDLYENNGLQYVLLGGDDSVVPVQYCYAEINTLNGVHSEPNLPCDNFYASTEGAFDWDANSNGIAGEMNKDNVQITTSIYHSRIPVRTTKQVDAIIDKIINYETNPYFANRMLLCGNKITSNPNDTTQNDAEWWAHRSMTTQK